MKTLESRFEIGELVEVILTLRAYPVYAYVRTITFTSSRVRYSVRLKENDTTLHNLDSVLIVPVEPKVVIEMPADNYS